MALTAFMSDQPKTELSRFQDAIKNYKTNTSLYATRTTMLAADVLASRKHYPESVCATCKHF